MRQENDFDTVEIFQAPPNDYSMRAAGEVQVSCCRWICREIDQISSRVVLHTAFCSLSYSIQSILSFIGQLMTARRSVSWP